MNGEGCGVDYRGRVTAFVLAACCGLLPVAVYAVLERHAAPSPAVLLWLAVCLCILLTIAWVLGRAYDRIRMSAAQDELTKCWNRKFAAETFPRLMRQATRRRKRLSISIVDLDDFKAINDRYGHQAGDQVLQRIAQALAGCASKGEIVARWGGDEFVVICPYGRSTGSEALPVKIEQALEQLSLRAGVRISASVGTSVFPEDGRTLQELLQAADKRMYADKAHRKAESELPEPVTRQA